MDVDREIDYLVGYQYRTLSQNGHVIPEYLIPCYSRLAAIANLVALENPTMKVIAALLRVGVLDEEDADYQVRATAIEELHRIDPNLAIETAQRLKDDEDEMVRDYAAELLGLPYTKSRPPGDQSPGSKLKSAKAD